jgi:hypothetical protein
VYTTQPCDLPNSATPLTQAQIDAQNNRVARVGQRFVDGNITMSRLVAALTPPPPTGTCDDLTSSLALSNLSPFPWPRPALAGGVGDASAGGASNPDGGVGGSSPVSPSGLDYPHAQIMADVARLVPTCNTSTPGAYPWPGSANGAVAGANGKLLLALAALVVVGVAFSGGKRK